MTSVRYKVIDISSTYKKVQNYSYSYLHYTKNFLARNSGWLFEAKASQGAFATFLGVRLDEGRWWAFIAVVNCMCYRC